MQDTEKNSVKKNFAVLKSRFELPVQGQKIIAYICLKIDPDDPEQEIITLSVQEFSKACGSQKQCGSVYHRTKEIINKLAECILVGESEKIPVQWIDRAWMNIGSGTVKIKIAPEMKPYFYELRQRITPSQLKNMLKMNSKYSIQLFELLKSCEHQKIASVRVDRLKKFLMIDKIKSYEDFGRFNLNGQEVPRL